MRSDVPKIKAPKGYKFKVIANRFSAQVNLLLANGVEIGHITLVRDSSSVKNIYRTHSTLNSAYHRKGLGSLMYARAIQFALEKGYSISSSGGSSDAAQRVWKGKTIRKYFTIKLKRRDKNYRHDRWYAYVK